MKLLDGLNYLLLKFAEYLEQEAIASHYGQTIHKRGKLTSLRNQLANHNALEWEVVEDGKKTPVRCIHITILKSC